MTIRKATHARSWYSGDARTLDSQLSAWLDSVPITSTLENGNTYEPPLTDCKAVIAPHAGYAYSGPTAAWAYKAIDPARIRRVFILGPSHHVYLDGCALSSCSEYATPIGNLSLDRSVIDGLQATGEFSVMSLQTDEDEHSIEMHLPYIRKVFENMEVSIVPILVGAITGSKEQIYGQILAPYLLQEDTIFVASSDFCHWGSRFSFTQYYPTGIESAPIRLDRRNAGEISKEYPVHRSIRLLDHEGMDILGKMSATSKVHGEFGRYLARTGNTICGRHPIGVLVAAVECGKEGGRGRSLRWVRYEQSSACETVKDSSVSYASGYVTME